MCAHVAAAEDRSDPLSPLRSPWRVTSVKGLEDFILWVELQDGTPGSIEMRDFVHAPDAGVFSGLTDPARFAEVYVDFVVVTWPGELDLAPDAMHRAIRETGRRVLV